MPPPESNMDIPGFNRAVIFIVSMTFLLAMGFGMWLGREMERRISSALCEVIAPAKK